MKTAFITGAAGFLGSHLVDEMLRTGYRVIGYDNLSHGNLNNLENARLHPNFIFHFGNICDRQELKKAAGSGVDLVLHLAAFKIPRYGKATDTLRINSDGTLNALQLAIEHSAKFVFTSTSDVYGKNPLLPFSEESDTVLGPPTISRWAYAASKLFDEHLVLAMSEDHGIPATVIRIFGSYGPRQHLSWWGGPQAVFIDAVLRNQTVPLHGDGLQTRSFTYVSDTVRGIAAVGAANCLNHEIINIGNNVEITILELAQEIHRLCGVPWPLRLQMLPYNEISGRRYEDVRRRVPDITKAKRTLGFEARVTLDEGLQKTIEWQRPLVLGQPVGPEAETSTIVEGVRA